MLVRTACLALWLSPLVAAASGAAVGAQCNSDNCLRALRATAKLEQARTDCASWLVSTVTPVALTETEYSTIESTSTFVASATVDNTIEATATVTVSVTPTSTVYVTSTTTIKLGGKAKRTAEPLIPTYASACSDTIRYSSACSCISATPVTTTLAASTTTTTVPTTVWRTETQTRITTHDVSATVATTSVTTTVAAVTVTSVATATVTPFLMTINDEYGFWYLYTAAGNDFMLLTQDASKAARFEIRDDASVWTGARFFARHTSTGVQYTRNLPSSSLSQNFVAAFKCSLNSNSELTCQIFGNPANRFATQIWREGDNYVRWSGTSMYHGTIEEITASKGNTMAFVTVKAIPVP